ncbi:MAG: hypothetical protein ABH810_03680 [bacterium]
MKEVSGMSSDLLLDLARRWFPVPRVFWNTHGGVGRLGVGNQTILSCHDGLTLKEFKAELERCFPKRAEQMKRELG